MIRFFVTRPALVFVLVSAIYLTGGLATSKMTKELWPPVEINQVQVTTVLPGASPDEVEQLVTIPLEEELEGLDDVDYLESASTEGLSSISVVYRGSVREREMPDKERDVQQRVNRVANLPDDASTPVVYKISTTAMPVAIYAVAGRLGELRIRNLADDLREELGRLHGAKKAWTAGARERELVVQLDPQRLEAYQLSVADVQRAIAARHVDVPAGSLLVGQTEYFLRVLGKPESLADFSRLVVARGAAGNVTLGDVAQVRDDFKDASILAHLNGRRSVLVQFSKENEATTADLVRRADAAIAAFTAQHPGLEVRKVFDSSVYVKARFDELIMNGIQGFVLVVLILWYQLGLRRALIVAQGIPMSYVATFLAMFILGISANFMTLYGLFIVLGVVVDDAIVLMENITRHQEQGESPRQAAIQGARQVALPVVMAVSSSMIAFSTMLLMSGTMGRFMSFLPKVVILVLCISLIESILFTPAHTAEWVPTAPAGTARQPAGSRLMGRCQELAAGLLELLLRRPYVSFCLPLVAIVSAFTLAALIIPVEMFPPEEPDELHVLFELPAGSTIDATEQAAYNLHGRIRALGLEDIGDVYTAIGYAMAEMATVGKNAGQVICVLKDRSARAQSGFTTAEALRQALENQIPGLTSLKVTVPESGPPAGKPVHVRLLGDDWATLEGLAEELKAFVARQPGAVNIDDDRKHGNPELQVRIDEDKCGRTGVDFGTVALTARAMYVGLKAEERRLGDETVDITLKGPAELRRLREALGRATVPSEAGPPVPLAELVDVRPSVGPLAIYRRDGEHSLTVTADLRGGDGPEAGNGRLITAAIAREFAPTVAQRHPGYRVEFGGEAEQQAESFASLGIAFVAALFLIYGLLVLQFNTLWQPFCVMLIIPLCMVGVIGGMIVFGESFNLSTMIGIIALAGMAVNDGVVYIDYINQLRREGRERDAALLEAARTRLRPILLTSVTTIAGLLPLAMRWGGGSAYLSPLASTIVYGLSVQTISTVTLIPIAYRVLEDLTAWTRRALSRVLPPPDPRDLSPGGHG